MVARKTKVQEIMVRAAENGRKLLPFIQAHLGEALPQGLFMRLVRKGQIRINGKRCQPFARVITGQKVRIPPLMLYSKPPGVSNADLDIIFEDETLLVVNKKAGLPVHPGSGWTDSVQTRLRALSPDAALTPIPVHRLDRDTSGLLLCAKTHAFLRQMHSIWPMVTKAYLCWVHGQWQQESWCTIQQPLSKERVQGQEKMVVGQGQDAVTHVLAIEVGSQHSLLLVVLGTGRTHQIRAHLASLGHAIVGDGKYGRGGEPLRLHATALYWSDQEILLLPSWDRPYAVDQNLATHLRHQLSLAPGLEKI